MSTKSLRKAKDIPAVNARKSERWSAYGQEMERRVEDVLRKSQRFHSVRLTEHHGKEDCEGKDFVVEYLKDGVLREVAFGITISMASLKDDVMMYPEVAQYFFPINIKDDTIVKKIVELCNA